MSLERAIALVEATPRAAYPNPTVGAVIVSASGTVVGEGVTEPAGGRHGEIVALDQAGDEARGGTLYVTMEPCAHHGRTPPCSDAVVRAAVARVVAGSSDPNPQAAGGLEALRAAGIDATVDDRFEARRQNEAWRTWVRDRRPYVVFKAAVTLDGRVTVPGRRWVSGEDSRRLVHELRAQMDAVAVGTGTVFADNPRLDVRDAPVVRQPRRLAFGARPLPDGSPLEPRTGQLADELAQLAQEGVQSILLEGGPTLAAAFVEHGLVDKLILFVAPTLAGAGPHLLGDFTGARDLLHLTTRRVGADVVLEGYLREP
jgi:diaminohydroxyphosphoribosylaminopyrimidine deaminase / 5-amino-6-(5-phosphoribosylamino)uracil reductase